MSRKPVALSVDEYRQRARALQSATAEAAWSLVVSPAPIEKPREWRSLTPDESRELFDRLMAACGRFGSVDRNVRLSR